MSRRYYNTLNDTLALQLSTMFDAETRIRSEMTLFCEMTEFIHLQNEIDKYIEQSSNKLIKLERIFNYLMEEPAPSTNIVVETMLRDMQANMKNGASSRLRDLMLTSSFFAMSSYKLAVYNCAAVVSLELEVETISDLLKEIVNWERETTKSLLKLTMEEVVYNTGFKEF